MREFVVREYEAIRANNTHTVVRFHLVEVWPRPIMERCEITLYLAYEDPEAFRYVQAHMSGERIRIDFTPAPPVDASEVW